MGTRRRDDGELERLLEGLVRDAGEEGYVPPEMVPVIEAGGGVAEGFELSEQELIKHAEDTSLDTTRRVLRDALPVEAEPDRAVYGEGDHEHSSEDED